MSEEHFFETPSIDRIMKVVLSLATELHVTCDRMKGLEFMLADAGILDRHALDHFNPNPDQEEEMLNDRSMFIESLLSPITADIKS